MYLDYAASTPIIQPVKDKAIELMEYFGNPSSAHTEGLKAKNIIALTNDIIANSINCNMDELHYTSGATMSNNLAIQGYLWMHSGALFITSTIEHNDIILLGKSYFNTVFVDVNKDGFIDIKQLENILKINEGQNIICSIQMANSETGVVQDIENISRLVHEYGGVFHTDATQYIPYYPVDVNKLGIDMMSMSGQKIGCIKGTGLLYVKRNINLQSVIYGEQGLIGGTENTLGIGCLGEAFKHIDYDYTNAICRRDELINSLDGELIGSRFKRLPNNAYILFSGVKSERLQDILNANEIYVSGGSACSSLTDEPSHVVQAMGYSPDEAGSCIRFTLPRDITTTEIEYVAKVTNINYKLLKG